GLNLTFETREGILKHCSLAHARQLGEVGQRFIDRKRPGLEAQLANLADEIAYNNHDIDDGLRSGLITIEQMRQVQLFATYHDEVSRLFPEVTGRRLVAEIIRRMINALIVDLTNTTRNNLHTHKIQTRQDVTEAPALLQFSDVMRTQADELKSFLMHNLYRHYKVMRMANKASTIVQSLFKAFVDDPRLMPADYRHEDERRQARAIADYIAGMTDRYAIKEYKRLFVV
ncbi:MAG: deoxyguanosinetriphosphate triphosphohydrolase, partial [Advenella sp.]